MWIVKDFEPATAARNTSGGYRLLVLDGHNSHCTYGFCKFAEKHHIIIICLPSHTTHALQPCDVACFGPLASAWKSEVNSASADFVEITKRNLLVFYTKARERALKKSTIISAFAKTGIWPFDRHALNPSVFEPSKNTTTEPAQPMPAKLPTLLVPIHTLSDGNNTSTVASEARYTIPLPPALPHTATRVDLHHENQELRHTICLAEVQLEKDFTQMTLMDSENGRLRKQVHAKETKKAEKKSTTQAHARLMTGAENLDALAEKDFMKHWKDVMKELAPTLKRIRRDITDHYKSIAAAAAAAKRAARGRGLRRGGLRGHGGRSKGQGRGRGRGRGKVRGGGLEEELEGEDFEGLSSGNESSSNEGGRSKSSESGEGDQSGEYGVVDIPPVPTHPIVQVVRPRPRPRPTYRMTAPTFDVTHAAEVPNGHSESRPPIGGAPVAAGAGNGTGTAADGQIAVDNERRYPRRSNRTNPQFTPGIDV
jgi:hypothetical protein